MDSTTQARFEVRARVIKAMAHPTRLYIVDLLSNGEMCVCDLTERIGADVSTVSKHLAVLRNVGIVQDEKRGAQVYYTLRCKCILRFFECVETVLETTAKDQLNLTR